MWRAGDRVAHRFNEELGPGRVVTVEDRFLVVVFPEAEETLRFAADTDALVPEEESSTVGPPRLVDRIAEGDVDPVEELATRAAALRLEALRRADGLGSFLGGRVELFPHQLYVAERAVAREPVRWLLADEVGLGKTVEACLILNHLLRAGRARRSLVLAPDALAVQWLGELWRKFHQVFTLLDEKRIGDVERELGRGFNPFEAHDRLILSTSLLLREARLQRLAAEAPIDVLVVDEAHHMKRPRGTPGNPLWRAVEPLAASAPHTLLLTATPFAEDAFGFARLLQLLEGERLPDEGAIDAALRGEHAFPTCVSATRREDIGDFPPRVPRPEDAPGGDGAWEARRALESAIAEQREGGGLAARRRAEALRRALSSGAALAETLPAGAKRLRAAAARADAEDPRLAWLAHAARAWRDRGEKTLVFVAERATLELVRGELSRRAQLGSGVFHEDLSPAQRDLEVSRFRAASGPSLLVATECGGEGRNFQFCTRLVLFDLPWSPVTLEQRIGRLDRIGRRRPVEILYLLDSGGFERVVRETCERIGIFTKPLGGLEAELVSVEDALEQLAGGDASARPRLDAAIQEARSATERTRGPAHAILRQNAYRRAMGPAILARVPEDLEDLTEEVVRGAAEMLGLKVETLGGEARVAIEMGAGALLESLPGVPDGASFLGSFRREEAVEEEMEDFFAAGHPLLEGLLAWLSETERGRAGLLHLGGAREEELGLAAFSLRRGGDARLEVSCVDHRGNPRPDWSERLSGGPLKTRRVRPEAWTSQSGWARAVRAMAARLPAVDAADALAVVRFSPSE